MVSKNFDLREFVPREVYSRFGSNSLWFVDPQIVAVCQLVKDLTQKAVIVNNWHTGGHFNESGYRHPHTLTGANFSQHKRGHAADIKVMGLTAAEVFNIVQNNWLIFKRLGLTTAEDVAVTKSWLHLDTRVWPEPSELLHVVQP